MYFFFALINSNFVSSLIHIAEAGKFQDSMNLSAQAQYHSRMGLVQYEQSQAEWIMAVPQ